MSSLKKLIISGIIVLIVLGGAAAFLLMPEKLAVDTVKRTDISQSVSVTGNIEADEIETIYAPVTGRIESITIQPGDAVRESEVIASYDITLLENEYIKASAALEANRQGYEAAVSENSEASDKFAAAKSAEISSRSELESALANINALDITNRGDYLQPEDYSQAMDLETHLKTIQQDIQINLSDKAAAEGRLQVAEGSETEYRAVYNEAKEARNSAQKALDEAKEAGASAGEITALEDKLSEAKSYYHNAKKMYEDIEEQIDDAQEDVDNATNSLYQNRDKFSSALTQLDDINKRNYSKTMSDEEYMQYVNLESRIKLLEQDFTKSLSDRQYNESKLINSHTLKQYEHNVDISEVDVSTADYTLTLAKEGVIADKSGVILEKFIDSNAMVQVGTPVCTLQPLNNIKVEAKISKFDIDKIAIKQEADIVVGESRYKGYVSKIFPVAEKDESGKPKVKVWIDIDVSDNIPTIGLEAQVIIHTGADSEALSVPFESVYSDDDGDYVYVLEGTKPQKRYIEVGIMGNENYSVISGVSEGETVIVTPFSDDRLEGRYRAVSP